MRMQVRNRRHRWFKVANSFRLGIRVLHNFYLIENRTVSFSYQLLYLRLTLNRALRRQTKLRSQDICTHKMSVEHFVHFKSQLLNNFNFNHRLLIYTYYNNHNNFLVDLNYKLLLVLKYINYQLDNFELNNYQLKNLELDIFELNNFKLDTFEVLYGDIRQLEVINVQDKLGIFN